MNVWIVVATSVLYLGLLFAIAYYGDRRADQGRSVIANGWIYGLSIAVYATTWTYYGSVGRAAEAGVGFLPIYLGPTLIAIVWVVLMRKIVRICKEQRITSLADFVSSRYGKSAPLGALVTVVAVVGVVPYIALQLKAVSTTFVLLHSDDGAGAGPAPSWYADTALWVALLLAAFTIIFGTRHLDATERHEGMVAAIAFESVVKLLAFLAVGVYVTYVMFDGFGDLFGRAAADPELSRLLDFGATQSHTSWVWLIILSALAFILLPRQWQVGVVENVDERHLRTATWILPAYLLLINIFVLPITIAGLVLFANGGVQPDDFVLALPLSEDQQTLALIVFIGGLSAATGMVIVETIALSTMVSNSLVLPALLRRRGALRGGRDLGRSIINIRRLTIVVLLLLGFAYVRVADDALTLVSIGLVSFAAVAQFAPAVLGGLYWKGASARGAAWGLAAGFAVWAYTLPLPSLVDTGLVSQSFVDDGPFGLSWLAPSALFGVSTPDPISHTMLWSMLINIGLFVGLSLTGRRGPREHLQAQAFVDVYDVAPTYTWRGTATVGDLRHLLTRFLGDDAAGQFLERLTAGEGDRLTDLDPADPALVDHVETQLAGAIGSVSARVLIRSATAEEPLSAGEAQQVLDEASQVLAHSRQLERKSAELEAATDELQKANARLQELDRLKDDFISSVTHELRTPLTSIRAFSEILRDNPELSSEQRGEYLGIVVSETERLSRLIGQVLDLSKLESEVDDWEIEELELDHLVTQAVESARQIAQERGVTVDHEIVEGLTVRTDPDRVTQVLVNVLGNAVKFAPDDTGEVALVLRRDGDEARVDVTDNGPGIAAEDHESIFDKFHQTHQAGDRVAGTGLGLPISRRIVDRWSGQLWVTSEPGAGSTFSFTIPLVPGPGTPDMVGKSP